MFEVLRDGNLHVVGWWWELVRGRGSEVVLTEMRRLVREGGQGRDKSYWGKGYNILNFISTNFKRERFHLYLWGFFGHIAYAVAISIFIARFSMLCGTDCKFGVFFCRFDMGVLLSYV